MRVPGGPPSGLEKLRCCALGCRLQAALAAPARARCSAQAAGPGRAALLPAKALGLLPTFLQPRRSSGWVSPEFFSAR